MKSVVFFPAAVVASAVTPTEKVVEMLTGMVQKGKDEKHAEQVQFATYKQFCDDTSTDKTRAIEEANNAIEKLSADIQKAQADAAKLGREIAAHEHEIAMFKGDKEAATNVRTTEREDYTVTHQDYSESVDALKRAIAVLKAQNFDRSQATALLQTLDPLIPVEKKSVITAFLKQDPEAEDAAGLGVEAPDAHGYEFQSGGVIDMLEKLETKFMDERSQLEKDESNAKHSYEMLVQDLTAQIAHNEQAVSDKTALKGKKQQAAADAKGDLADTTATRDDDTKYLADLTATCKAKSSDFESRQQLRADEVAALEKAIEVLSSGTVSGAAEKYLPTLLQKSARSLMQLSKNSKVTGDRQVAVASFLSRAAERYGSRVLSELATHAEADPFGKVKKMLQDLITRLMEEANQEAEQKGWCDTELAKNAATRDEKTDKVEALTAEIDGLTASIAKLGEDLTTLNAQISELDSAVAEATKMRNEEHEKNTITVKESKEAQTAVAQALQVLKEFYAKAGTATAFLQQQPDAPEIFDAPYTGMSSENGGVVGMIEVIQSDFARLEAETTASEASAQEEYDSFMSDSAVDKAQKKKDVEHKTHKKQSQTQALQEKKGDLEGTSKELTAANEYFDKLKPTCIGAEGSYEDRVSKREEEVESLQEALRILNGES